MPLFGAHESVAGGLHLAFDRIDSVGGESLQIFTRNQRQWKPKPLSDDEVRDFHDARERFQSMPVASHASYLVNLATAKDELLEKSIAALTLEFERCRLLGVPYVVMHPGSHGGDGVEAGLTRFIAGMDRVLEQTSDEVMLLVETTAGQGTGLGSSFTEIGTIRSESRFPEKIGVCVDTCHIFAAGYDLRTTEAYQATMVELDREVGLAQVKFFHLNDSKKGCGSRVDRHEHIGKGMIGLEGFRHLVNDQRFATMPMTIETDKGDDLAEDRENIAVLRSLLVT
ncbi:deoxyribonuclease IV [Desulfopila aestuarii]|uniref:Probable endonuclease 4 n=1 Tax=Desulfopila aestuarii DSM 18488 TaxID=1121416 RepID=A0A1M7YD31_9BACT|nr:deoxyribonuclease IV [Desulfopila aestuarii]SHO50418.1 Endonuclease IV [Desulfopila aestuarii DSM 18488]